MTAKRLLFLLDDAYVVAKRLAKAGSADASAFVDDLRAIDNDLLLGGGVAKAREAVGRAWAEHGPLILAFCHGEKVLEGEDLRACVKEVFGKCNTR